MLITQEGSDVGDERTARGCWTPYYYLRHSQALGQDDDTVNAHGILANFPPRAVG